MPETKQTKIYLDHEIEASLHRTCRVYGVQAQNMVVICNNTGTWIMKEKSPNAKRTKSDKS